MLNKHGRPRGYADAFAHCSSDLKPRISYVDFVKQLEESLSDEGLQALMAALKKQTAGKPNRRKKILPKLYQAVGQAAERYLERERMRKVLGTEDWRDRNTAINKLEKKLGRWRQEIRQEGQGKGPLTKKLLKEAGRIVSKAELEMKSWLEKCKEAQYLELRVVKGISAKDARRLNVKPEPRTSDVSIYAVQVDDWLKANVKGIDGKQLKEEERDRIVYHAFRIVELISAGKDEGENIARGIRRNRGKLAGTMGK